MQDPVVKRVLVVKSRKYLIANTPAAFYRLSLWGFALSDTRPPLRDPLLLRCNSMAEVSFTRVGNGGYATAEGPVYHPEDKKFYFVDIEGMRIGAYDPAKGEISHHKVGELVGGAAPYEGKLLVVRKDGIFRLDYDSHEFNLVCRLEVDKPWNRPNDIALVKCADGITRIFIGTMPLVPADRPKAGALYVLDPRNGNLELLRDQLTSTNGLAGYTEDNVTHLFFSDSHVSSQKIFRAIYDPMTNSLSKEEVFLDMTEMEGRPDGGTLALVDDRLCHVIAAIDTGSILFHDVRTREQLACISLPGGVLNVTKCALSPEGLIFATTLNRAWKEGPDPLRYHGELYVGRLPANITCYNANLQVDHIATDGSVAGYKIGDNPLKPFAEMVHTRQRLVLPDQHNSFAGVYPPELWNVFMGQRIAFIGYGQVVERMIGPAADYLGLHVEYYDAGGKPPRPRSRDIQRHDPLHFSPDAVVMILSPPAAHAHDIKRLAAAGTPFYVEKPIVVGEQLEETIQILSHLKAPAYCGDFHYFMALPFMTLVGAKMPYRDTIEVTRDTEDGVLRRAVDTRQPLFELHDVVHVSSKYIQGGEAAASTLQGRNLGRGAAGGMVYDLVVHQLDILNAIGLEVGDIHTVDLATNTETSGVYRRLTKAELIEDELSDMYARITGEIGNYGATFDFEAAKYGAKDDQFIQVDLADGRSVRFEYHPPYRKTCVLLLDAGRRELGRIDSLADPYLLMMAHMIDHLRSGRQGAVFGHEGLLAVEQMRRMHEFARKPVDVASAHHPHGIHSHAPHEPESQEIDTRDRIAA